jgi:hypothetical protein
MKQITAFTFINYQRIGITRIQDGYNDKLTLYKLNEKPLWLVFDGNNQIIYETEIESEAVAKMVELIP